MAGRQGQNKGSKNKPGFQPVVGKGITPPTAQKQPVASTAAHTVLTESDNTLYDQLNTFNSQLYTQYKNNQRCQDEYVKLYNATRVISRKNDTNPSASASPTLTKYLKTLENTIATEYKNDQISRDEYIKIYNAIQILLKKTE